MNLIDRVKNMLTTPKTEWMVVAAETPDSSKVVMGYVLPLAIAGAVAAFIGWALIGVGFLGGTSWGLYFAIAALVQTIISVYVTAFVVDALAPSFNSEKNFGRSLQLVAYGSTPAFVAGLFNILPVIAGIVVLVGAVYSIYLIYLGLGPIKKTPEDKKVVYLIVCIIALIVVYIILGFILARLLYPILGLGVGYRMGL
jgi:Yip1 domain